MNTVSHANLINNKTTHIHPAEAHPDRQPQRTRIAHAEAQPLRTAEGLGSNPAQRSSEKQESAVALVSSGEKFGSGDMLTAKVLLANEVMTAHLDSCATHCFVSSDVSVYLSTKGYTVEKSPIRYDVMQGNPLCSTKRVHYVPLTMVREDGTTCTWDRCLLIVADAGAPIILCNPLLRQGGIIRYNPPDKYESILRQSASLRAAQRQDGATTAVDQRSSTGSHDVPQSSTYGPPNEETQNANSTELPKVLVTEIKSQTESKNHS